MWLSPTRASLQIPVPTQASHSRRKGDGTPAGWLRHHGYTQFGFSQRNMFPDFKGRECEVLIIYTLSLSRALTIKHTVDYRKVSVRNIPPLVSHFSTSGLDFWGDGILHAGPDSQVQRVVFNKRAFLFLCACFWRSVWQIVASAGYTPHMRAAVSAARSHSRTSPHVSYELTYCHYHFCSAYVGTRVNSLIMCLRQRDSQKLSKSS